MTGDEPRPDTTAGTSALVCHDGGDRVTFEGALCVGRDPLNELILWHPRVSSRHAVILWSGGSWRLRDLGSQNGSTVNGRRVQAWQTLAVGDVIRFAGESSWTVEKLWAPTAALNITAMVEITASHRRVVMSTDRFVIGTTPWCELTIDPGDSSMRGALLVLFGEEGSLWAEPVVGVPGIRLDGEAWSGEALLVDQARQVTLGDTELTLIPGVVSHGDRTERVQQVRKEYDLSLQLTFEGPADGLIRIDHPGGTWSTRAGMRFVFLYLLASAGGDWVADRDIKIGLWGKGGDSAVSRSAYYKLIHDTRQMFMVQGIDGWFIDKRRGSSRLRIPASRIRIIQS